MTLSNLNLWCQPRGRRPGPLLPRDGQGPVVAALVAVVGACAGRWAGVGAVVGWVSGALAVLVEVFEDLLKTALAAGGGRGAVAVGGVGRLLAYPSRVGRRENVESSRGRVSAPFDSWGFSPLGQRASRRVVPEWRARISSRPASNPEPILRRY